MRRPLSAALRNRHFLALDVGFTLVAPFLLFALRFEGLHWPPGELETAVAFTAVALPLRILIYHLCGVYRHLWRYAGVPELETLFLASVAGSVAAFFAGRYVIFAVGLAPHIVPLSVLFNSGVLSLVFLAAPRLAARSGGVHLGSSVRRPDGRRTLIAGAGVAGQMIIREIRQNADIGVLPIGFVDDDPAKQGMSVAGVPVLGRLADIGEVARRVRAEQVVIAMPSAPGSVVRTVLRAALDAGLEARTIPGLSELLSGQVEVGRLREVRIEDLLRREPIRTNMDEVRTLATDRTVLVTGAGGSIGSELARQVARLRPSKLLLLGHGENPIFHVLNELRAAHPDLDLVPVIADIRDRRRMFQVMETHRPFAVFHAAAHKHVPLMEANVIEALTNNVKGTTNIVDAAVSADVEHFVLISTDKAVRPTSVMGASKRVAEHVVRGAALRHGKNFVAVRFGNVLGSEGSVVPTFMKQIRAGGPVTVTHPEMQRYFMTIPEAVQLVLQAGAIGRGGELFMLDMGEPVKIVDLASDLIRLSGLEVGVDVEIRFTGVRPGEKLYEEMFFEHEETSPTAHPKVLCAKDALDPGDSTRISELVQATFDGAPEAELRRMLRAIVPDYSWQPTLVAVPSEVPEVALRSGKARRSGAGRAAVNG